MNQEWWDNHPDKALNTNQKVYHSALELLPPNRNLKILDVGCGTGIMEDLLKLDGYYDILGLDWSRQTDHQPFKRMDIEKEELPKGFDLVICLEVLEHVTNPYLLLKKLLSSGREIIISTPNGFYNELKKFNNEIPFPSEYIYFTESILRNIITKAGGEILEWCYVIEGRYQPIKKFKPRLLAQNFVVKFEMVTEK